MMIESSNGSSYTAGTQLYANLEMPEGKKSKKKKAEEKTSSDSSESSSGSSSKSSISSASSSASLSSSSSDSSSSSSDKKCRTKTKESPSCCSSLWDKFISFFGSILTCLTCGLYKPAGSK